MPLSWHVYLDESGRSIRSFDNKNHPSLTLAAVITTHDKLDAIDAVRSEIVSRAGLNPSTEIHASPCLHGQDAFEGLEIEKREEILRSFVEANQDNYLFFYAPDMLKTMVRPAIQRSIRDRGLSQYTAVFLYLLVTIGKFVDLILHGHFRVFFDRNDAVMDELMRVAEHLRKHDNDGLRTDRLHGKPEPIDSQESAAVQLADVVAHYACRHHRVEIPKFDHGPALDKFREKIESFYHDLLQPKDLPWLVPEIYLNVDWKALQSVSFHDRGN